MAIRAKVFKSGNSQAVRLPKAFRLDVDEVEIRREGDNIVLTLPADKTDPWANFKAAIAMDTGEDIFADGPEDLVFDERPELDDLFK